MINAGNDLSSGMVHIQAQDVNGNWRIYQSVHNNDGQILLGMRQLAKSLPNKRIRAIDSNGRIVDIL